MITKRQSSPEPNASSEQVGALATASLTAGGSTKIAEVGGPARQLQSRLADAITASPQTGAWHVNLGHISGFNAATIPQQAKSIAVGISGGAFIAACLFLILD